MALHPCIVPQGGQRQVAHGHDHTDLLESTKKFLWEDIFSPEFGYNFMALKPREQGLDESEKKVGDLELQEILGEGQVSEPL